MTDLRFLWAAYRRGSLASMGVPDGMSPDEFSKFVETKVSASCHFGWAMLTEDKPSGYVFASWSPFNRFLECVLVVWMPWASKRNILASAIYFLNNIRKEVQIMGYALPEHKGLYEVACKHGIMRRIGTSYNAIPGKHVAIFETIKGK